MITDEKLNELMSLARLAHKGSHLDWQRLPRLLRDNNYTPDEIGLIEQLSPTVVMLIVSDIRRLKSELEKRDETIRELTGKLNGE